MKPGDLVRHKKSEFVTDRVRKEHLGLVLRNEGTPAIGTRLTVYVQWNVYPFTRLWHNPGNLEVVNEKDEGGRSGQNT